MLIRAYILNRSNIVHVIYSVINYINVTVCQQRSIRPQVVTTFELPGCLDMWTVVGPRKPKKTPEEEEAKVEKDDTNTEEADKVMTPSSMSRRRIVL